jgi:hypothetical protein
MKMNGWFEIWDKDVLLLKAQNHVLENGARWLLSALANALVSEGYPANATKYFVYGNSDDPIDVTQWHLQSFAGSLGAITSYTFVDDNHIRFELDYTTGVNPISISELALSISGSDPTSKSDKTNTVIDRAVVSHVIPALTTRNIKYNLVLTLV